MILRFLTVLLLWAFPVVLRAQGTLASTIPGAMSQIVRDGQGRVWAMIKGERGGAIHRLNGPEWRQVTAASMHAMCRIVAMEALPGGDIACLWKDDNDKEDLWLVSLHTGDTSRIAWRFRAALEDPVVAGAADGRVFVTGKGRTCVRLFPGKEEPEVITLPEHLYVPPKANAIGGISYDHAQVRVVVDRKGTAWLWSPELAYDSMHWRLAGLVKWGEGDEPLRYFPLNDHPQRVSSVVAWDAEHILAAFVGFGPYLLKHDSNEWTPLPGSSDEAFRYVEQFFHDGTAWHAVTVPRPTEIVPPRAFGDPIERRTFYEQGEPTCDLRRREGDSWVIVHQGLDTDPAQQRSWLATEKGLFVASDRGPPWFVPREGGEARRLCEPAEFPLPAVKQMVAMGDAAVIFNGVEAGPACMWPATGPVMDGRPRHMRKLTAMTRAVVDEKGQIWMFQDRQTFLRWDGKEWRTLPAPAEPAPIKGKPAYRYPSLSSRSEFVGDNRNRGWLLEPMEGPVLICDFATGKWQDFPDYRSALVAQLPSAAERKAFIDRGEAPDPEPSALKIDLPIYLRPPKFSNDGRIAYGDYSRVVLYEGSYWQEWKTEQVFPGPLFGAENVFFFAQDGKFSVARGDMVMQWDRQKETWERAHGIPVPETRAKEPEKIWNLPDGSRLDSVSRGEAARDNHGVIWVAQNDGRLVKMVPGRTVSVCDPGPLNPFRMGSSVNWVYVDPMGNALLTSPRPQYAYLFLPAKAPVPESAVRLVRTVEDTAHLALGAKDAPAWHRWRLDGGEWQPLVESPELVVEKLRPGHHTVEVRAYSAELTPSRDSQKVTFEITGMSDTEFASHLRELSKLDMGAREAAASKFKSQGAAILPRLHEARPTVSSSVQWWIDAIVQDIERQPIK